MFYPKSEYDCGSPVSDGHRQSFSLSNTKAGASKPCIFFSRGYCKNGSSCRFIHGLPKDDTIVVERDMTVMRAKAFVTVSPRQLMASIFPLSTSLSQGINLNFLLHHHQHKTKRMAAAATAMLLDGEDMRQFPVQSPQMDKGDVITSSAARQIYMTFPADSTFSVEDVTNYFSTYGPVQDVRIPYQKKRMFGFVAFVYAESVKIILSKGNPHFVSKARVLVKPYKEKGKVDIACCMFKKLHEDFTGCTSPTNLFDSRDPFDLQKPQIGPRMMYGNTTNLEEFLRRKLKEQRQEDKLHQDFGMDEHQFMGLQILDLKSKGHNLGSPMPLGQANGQGNINGNGNVNHLEDVTIEESKMNNNVLAMGVAAVDVVSATNLEGKHEEQWEEDGDAGPKQVVGLREEKKRESSLVIETNNVSCGFNESGVVEHILPESPFASSTKASIDAWTSQNVNTSNSPHHVVSSLLPPTSTLELSPYNSCFFQVPR
ncbi:hypothetical protein HU200_030473 [Digitaria exilis]|uniref:Uncharacterized protein n=1 Tax=Digitaria exilis TaxID=1010633 RepID=A0A835BSS2_9POAL|nr:hypothetical protein HU200_030473 [Digitaria exilis]